MRRQLQRSEGASAVEFVFVLPLLVVLIFGIIQFGIAYNRSQGMHAAAREAARLASVGADVDDITTRVQSALGGTTVDAADVGVTITQYTTLGYDGSGKEIYTGDNVVSSGSPCDGTSDAAVVRVELEVAQNADDYAITIPLLSSFSQTFPSEAVFRCENQ